MDKVSVIIPVYNSEKYISRCIDSILNQTYKNIELLLINDGSKDDSILILNKYKKMDNRILVIDKKNEGVAKTRNLGIQKATGKYIMFVDNDDYLDKDYIEQYITHVDKNDILIGGYRRINSLKKILFSKGLTNSAWSKYIIMAPWAKLFKTSFLKKQNISFFSYPIGEDVYFLLMAYSKKPKTKTFDYIGYNWFYNEQSISNTSQRGLSENTDIVVLLNKINKFNIHDDYINYYYYRYVVWYLLFSGRNSDKITFINECNRLFLWLDDNVGKRKISSFSTKIKGESTSHRLSVFVFCLLRKLHLIGIFASLYCRGNNHEKNA